MADELLQIADDATSDITKLESDDGREVVNHEHIARSKLRVDTRKWLLSKCLPKVYGDKLLNEHSGPDGAPIEVQDNEAARRIAFMLGQAAGRGAKANEPSEAQ